MPTLQSVSWKNQPGRRTKAKEKAKEKAKDEEWRVKGERSDEALRVKGWRQKEEFRKAYRCTEIEAMHLSASPSVVKLGIFNSRRMRMREWRYNERLQLSSRGSSLPPHSNDLLTKKDSGRWRWGKKEREITQGVLQHGKPGSSSRCPRLVLDLLFQSEL